MSIFGDLDHLLKKSKKDDPEKPDPVAVENSAQNLAPAYDAAGNYTGMEAPQTLRKDERYGQDMLNVGKAIWNGSDAFARGMADVATLGNADRIAAAGNTLVDKLSGNERSYSDNLAAERARSKYDAENRAPMRIMGQLAGGIAGPFKGLNLMSKATTLPGRMVGGGANAAVNAVPYGYFSSEGDLGTWEGQQKAGLDALKSGGIGLAIGTAAPAVGSAIGYAVDFLRNRLSPDVFSTLPRATQRQLEQIARDTDLPNLQSEATRLGSQAMLADVSPEMRLIAQNVATRPGSASVVVDPLKARDALRNDRLQSAMEQTLGPNVDRLRVTDRLQALREQVGAQYPKLAATSTNEMPAFGRLASIDAIKQSPLGRDAATAEALNRIERVLTNPKTGEVGRSAAEFHAAREIADRYLQNPNTPADVMRAVGAIRRELDDALKGGVDGWKALDARFSDVAGRQEAFQAGQTIFNRGREALRPSEDARIFSQLNPKQQVADRLGVRAELDRLAGQSGNDLRQLETTLMTRGDDPYKKLTLRFGEDKTRRLYDAKDAERTFAETNNAVNSGSMTAQRMGANQMVSGGAGGGAGAPTTFAEMALAAKKKVSDAFQDAMYGTINQDTARQLGGMSVAQGKQRDEYIRALRGRANRTDPEGDIERTLRALRPGIIPSLLH